MKCKYCRRKCTFGSFNHNQEYNTWYCFKCYGGIDVDYKTEIRDDEPICITLVVPYKEKKYDICMKLRERTTIIKIYGSSGELLANFNYVMKITPKIAEDKLKTILTFG
jgi:Fe-S-cluster-containing dehydrogenase component